MEPKNVYREEPVTKMEVLEQAANAQLVEEISPITSIQPDQDFTSNDEIPKISIASETMRVDILQSIAVKSPLKIQDMLKNLDAEASVEEGSTTPKQDIKQIRNLDTM
jgi:hypothetical protein